MFQPLLGWLEVIVAVTVILAAAKSAYSGVVYERVLRPLERIERINEEVDSIKQRQQKMYRRQQRQIDAVIALGRSHRSESDFDEEAFERDVRGEQDSPSDYLSDD